MRRLFLDENVEGFLKRPLREAGYDVFTASESGLRGAADQLIYARAKSQECNHLITADLDSADILRFPLGDHSGIVVLRLRRLLSAAFAERTVAALSYEVPEDLQGSLAVVDGIKTRTRRP